MYMYLKKIRISAINARHDINEIWVVFTGVIAAARSPGNEASLRFMMEICGRVRDILDCVAV